MKHIALLIVLLAATWAARAQDHFLDPQFRGFEVFFEAVPQPNQVGQISVLYPACRRPFTEESNELFPTETQLVGSEITLTYGFFRLNAPTCFSGYVKRYDLPILQPGNYRIRVNARLISLPSSVPSQIIETRTMAQINFQVGEPLATQVPNLTPVGFALMSLMMLGVGAFFSGRRWS